MNDLPPPPPSAKDRLREATLKVMLDIMERGRKCYDGDGNEIPGKTMQPSAADIQAAMKLLNREEAKNDNPEDDPFADFRIEALAQVRGKPLAADNPEMDEPPG